MAVMLDSWDGRIDPESGCRLPLPSPDSMGVDGQRIVKRQLDPARGSLVGLHGPIGIRLHSPVIAESGQNLVDFFRRDSTLDAQTREVAILITARAHDSAFEWAAHAPLARKVGVPDETVMAIAGHRPVDGLDERDALIIAIGRELFGERRLSGELYGAAISRFGAKGFVELVSLMAMYAGTASLLAAFDMQLPDGAEVLPV
ncbi:MAG TPA: carboxymuconolactone decarboxylase family protein [Hyphomicrobiaceae bacterium]|nr:carboxymuconolactone decarboxylase family protein [Hyphomicrobiaceae bacterium]